MVELIETALIYDQSIAKGLVDCVVYDCCLIFKSKWKVVRILFEIHDFLQEEKLAQFFYSKKRFNLSNIKQKIIFFISYIKNQKLLSFPEFSDEILGFYNTRVKNSQN